MSAPQFIPDVHTVHLQVLPSPSSQRPRCGAGERCKPTAYCVMPSPSQTSSAHSRQQAAGSHATSLLPTALLVLNQWPLTTCPSQPPVYPTVPQPLTLHAQVRAFATVGTFTQVQGTHALANQRASLTGEAGAFTELSLSSSLLHLPQQGQVANYYHNPPSVFGSSVLVASEPAASFLLHFCVPLYTCQAVSVPS